GAVLPKSGATVPQPGHRRVFGTTAPIFGVRRQVTACGAPEWHWGALFDPLRSQHLGNSRNLMLKHYFKALGMLQLLALGH
ncbi:hypothetical protein PanWU01x14_181720, partial [Parasponia andersonii]